MHKRSKVRHAATASLGAIIMTHGLLAAFSDDLSVAREVGQLLHCLSDIEDRINYLLDNVDRYDDDLSLPPIIEPYVGSHQCDVKAAAVSDCV